MIWGRIYACIFSFLFKACSEELNFERLQTYIIFLSKYSTAEFAKDVSMVSTLSTVLYKLKFFKQLAMLSIVYNIFTCLKLVKMGCNYVVCTMLIVVKNIEEYFGVNQV